MDSKSKVDELEHSRVRATARDLVRLIWEAVKANKWLVVSVWAVGLLHAFCNKGLIILGKPFLEALGVGEGLGEPAKPTPGSWQEVAGGIRETIDQAFLAFSVGIRDFLGIEFAGSADDVQSKTFVLGCFFGAVLLGVVGSLAVYGINVLARYFAIKIVVDLRDRVARHILKLPMRFFAKRRVGDLISSITNDTTVLGRSFTLASDNIVADPLFLLFNFLILVTYAPDLWWAYLLLLPIMALPILRIGRRVRKSSSKSLAALGDSTEAMSQMLGGIKTVKAFQLEKQRQAEFEGSNALYLSRTKRMLRAKALSQGLLYFCYMLAFGGLIFVLGWWVINGDYQPQLLPMIVFPFASSYTNVKRLCRAYNVLMESIGALDSVESILRVAPDQAALEIGVAVDEVRGDVVFDNVSFAYEDEPVLRNVSFRVKAGQTVALVGPSGAGKSTTVDVLARFHDPISGRVLVDGRDLRDIRLQSYRRHLAVVSQQPFLFNTTIYDNILCGRPDASEDEVKAAASKAQIHDFIQTLPHGYQSLCGERGSNLSGGQMQRITIARAILRNPSILLLDEAMSALDSASEEAVQSALSNLMQDRTSFIIAHRLATVRDADLILVMDEGRVVESGTHQELTKKSGLYSRLSELQSL
ncbi:MAG: ABC transporter ATP-binding protein [Planctomycetota bacterium]